MLGFAVELLQQICLLQLVDDAQLTLYALIPIPFLAAGAMGYTMTSKDRHRAVRKASSAMNSLLHDNVAELYGLERP